MDRRVLTRDIKSTHEVGKVGTDQVQLYSKDGKLYAQLSSNDAVLISDLSTGSATPVGAVNAYAGATAPAGWLLCNGDAVTNGSGTVQSQTADFSDLYALLSTTYGSAGTLPDLAGRVISQENGTYARGVTGGAVDVTLATANIPAHNHTAALDSDAVTITQSDSNKVWMQECYDDGETKGYKFMQRATTCGSGAGLVVAGSAENSLADLLSGAIDDYQFTTDDAQGNGSGGVNDVDVRQPTLYMNYIIKF